MVSRLSLGGAPVGSRQSLTSSTDSPKPSRRAASRQSFAPPETQSNGSADDDFFDELNRTKSNRTIASPPNMTEEEQLQMALALSQSEADAAGGSGSSSGTPKTSSKSSKSKKKDGSKSKDKLQKQSSVKVSPAKPPAAAPGGDASEAVTNFTSALTQLDQGHLEHAFMLLGRALSKLPQEPEVAQQIAPVVHEWAAYRLLISLLIEMNRLEKERLWAQRALLAKFAALVATSGAITLSEHRLITLRMAINRNLEVGNFYTAAEFVRVMQAQPNLSEPDITALKTKFDMCREHGTESVIPVGATYDPNTGVRLEGRVLILCTKTMRLIRGNEFAQCSRCRATFSPSAVSDSCIFCTGPIAKRQF